MNCLLYVSSAAIFSKTNFIMKRSFYAFCSSSWKRSINHAGIKAVNLDFVLTRFRVQCYSSRRGSGGGRATPSSKPNPGPSSMGEDEKDAFYVVRKGDIVGVYKTLSDCQAQVGSSVCDPSVSVYKGYSLPEEAEEYLVAHGIKNAMYSISAEDVKGDLFGALVPCPFQQPVSPKGKTSKKDSPQKRSHEALELDSNVVGIGSTSVMSDPLRKRAKLEHSVEAQGISKILSCILEFDGASKGNPGKAGAGAVLRAEDGSVICRLREGVGIATNNVAEYRAMLLGLKYAIKKGFKRIRVQGDSKLVCMQVQGLWKAKNQNMLDLLKEAKELKDKFFSFEISHVLRVYKFRVPMPIDLNSDADAQANLAVNLEDGEVQVE